MNVEGATHKQVVDLIKSGGDTLTLTGLIVLLLVIVYQNVTQRFVEPFNVGSFFFNL